MDPKWRVISKKTGVSIPAIVGIWATIMEDASQSENRGVLQSWNAEDIAAGFDMETTDVQAVFDAMQNKTLTGKELTAWPKRNPVREDNSTDRVRRFREKKRDVTQCNDVKRKETLDKIRLDKTREEKKEERDEALPSPQRLFDLGKKALDERLASTFAVVCVRFPNRKGKDAAERHFRASVKSDEDAAQIIEALDRYLAWLKVNSWLSPKDLSTWLNKWRDSLDDKCNGAIWNPERKQWSNVKQNGNGHQAFTGTSDDILADDKYGHLITVVKV